MANKRVIVMSNSLNYDEVMDEAAIPVYISDAKIAGYFENSEATIVIPWENSAVKIQEEYVPYTP